MLKVSNADRVVFPELGKTKGEVVDYYTRIAPRALPHVAGRPLSIRRFPKGLAAAGFFQKNVPAHYPESIARFAVPRSRESTKKHRDPQAAQSDVTLYPVLSQPEHLAYLANQGAIELHVPTMRAQPVLGADRFIIDLDPPANSFVQVREAARITRDALARYGLETVPMATGSKGYHLIAPIELGIDGLRLALAGQKFAALLAAAHPELLTVAFRVALRGKRVFVDWLRNNPVASGIAPYSLRASAQANVAVPLSWDELESTDPDAFSITDVERLLAREDPLAALVPCNAQRFVDEVESNFERSGLVLEVFDRFRS